MKYFSTNHKAPKVSFAEALIKGLAPDKGLFMPEEIPTIDPEKIEWFASMEYHQIAFNIFNAFFKKDIPESELFKMCKTAYDFDVPLENVYERKYIMRLDQGPTASFKDFAGRMMGRLMSHFLKTDNKKLVILTATSGDTGSAMANAFYGLENIKVVVLFPKDEVTMRQRKQMTSLGKNISVLAVDGKFDDCQAMVKEAFSDTDLEYLNLSSSNSINIGRLLPQIVYYFYAYSKLAQKGSNEGATFCIPSGNFGDMMGCVLAKKMGLPIKKILIATNSNDEFPTFLNTETYSKIEPSKNALSSAMNVGHPSNLARLVELYGGNMDETGKLHKKPDFDKLRSDIFTISVSDEETTQTITKAWNEHKLLLEPHGAVGWFCLEKYLSQKPSHADDLFVSLETAHPAKFPEQIQQLLKFDPKLPKSLVGLDNLDEKMTNISNSYTELKTYLKDNF
ncbi:MAG: threonine synthase [Bacteroidales bacterium]|nr:threonine synthase [Bacteroidales bacterium]